MNSLIILSSIIFASSIEASEFWISAQIESVKWQEGCLTTALCTQPRFQIIEDLLPISERSSISWPVAEQLNQRQFVSYWPNGRVEDISISAQVIGVDRTYGFPRICDQTPAVRIFPEDIEIMDLDKEINLNNKTIHIKAKCFDAIITLQKHERCPWCQDPSEIEISNEIPQELIFSEKFSSAENLQISVVLLAMFAVLLSTAFAILLICYIKTKKSYSRKNQNMIINVQPKLIPYEQYTYSNSSRHPWSFTNSTSSTASTIPPPPSFPPPV
ncbi:unnamed protein product [Caenorhabditis angaria]|uniref:C2 domain-containing protein n=1 Tax=Caenorhabditis angaria TaxID=860376 RepID=A0A9P1MZV5_9PELO|nr:unnamed protein product [Caenorhabditis angaria]